MSVVYVVLPVSIVLAAIAVAWFIWAVRRGQFDDLETPRWRMLHDDDEEPGREASERRRPDARPETPPDDNPPVAR
jgi:cbb3-type cytochrome oxidase maturation protein